MHMREDQDAYGFDPIPGKYTDSKNIFTITSPDGELIWLEILFTFYFSDTNKHYIVYTSNEYYEDETKKIYASIYDPASPELLLVPIESEEEWAMVEYYLEEYQEMLHSAS